jgi:tRNA(adenine34) deaminase
MCLGAIAHARVDKIIFGAYDSKNRMVDSKNMPLVKSQLNLKMQIVGGVLEEDCKKILKSFFIIRRNST